MSIRIGCARPRVVRGCDFSRFWCTLCTIARSTRCTQCSAFPHMIEEMDKRGRTIPLPLVGEWWVRLARGVINSDPRDLRTLGADLGRHLKGRRKFDHATISRFASGTLNPKTQAPYDPTFELVDALCAEFSRLPRPLFFARNYEEAVHLQVTAERYGVSTYNSDDTTVSPLPITRGRKRNLANSNAEPSAPAKRRTKTG